MKLNHTVEERFLRYVKIDTQSDPFSETSPTTEKQKDLSRLLCQELKEMGIDQAETDEYGFVYAKIPSNSSKKTKSVFFCAHVDTAPDCSGTNVKPIVHRNYQGQEIQLPDDPEQILNIERYPNLSKKMGHDIVTASGLTLLGSDDKSGVASIMDAAYNIVSNSEIKHGDIYLLFTPDEEVGRGTKNINLEKIPADFGYTLDGAGLGSFEFENFSADFMQINITGVSAHPGMAKGKMENAIKIAGEIVSKLPKTHLSPETTELKQGFVHPSKMEAQLGSAYINFIIRDFDTSKLTEHEQHLKDITHEVLKSYPGSKAEFVVKEQYRNMRDIIEKSPEIIDYARKAFERSGVSIEISSIRGGTDGAMLSYMGLPCPNMFAGEQAIHSKHEWVSVQDMEKAVETIINICQIIEENGE